jgi:hypothetical protein
MRNAVPLALEREQDLAGMAPQEHMEEHRRTEERKAEERRRSEVCHNLSP